MGFRNRKPEPVHLARFGTDGASPFKHDSRALTICELTASTVVYEGKGLCQSVVDNIQL